MFSLPESYFRLKLKKYMALIIVLKMEGMLRFSNWEVACLVLRYTDAGLS